MKHLKQTIVFMIIALLLVNLVVFALKLISAILFWGIIIAAGLFAYKGLNKLK